jgi:hypothetical protein
MRPVDHIHTHSLPGIYQNSVEKYGVKPSQDLKEQLQRVAMGYLDTHQELTKVKVVNAIDSFLRDKGHRETPKTVATVLGGQLAQVWGEVTRDIKKLVDTEATRSKNVGALDAITTIADERNIADPNVFFLHPLDDSTCKECIGTFFLEDRVTPKVFKLSEISSAYYQRGSYQPCLTGCHPVCRGKLTPIAPGYGFKKGKLSFIAVGHDAHAEQTS